MYGICRRGSVNWPKTGTAPGVDWFWLRMLASGWPTRKNEPSGLRMPDWLSIETTAPKPLPVESLAANSAFEFV